MGARAVTPVVRLNDTTKTLTQVVRLLVNGLMEDAYADTAVSGERVTAAQFEVLRYIDRHCLPTVKQVAEALQISSAAATKAISGLADLRPVPLVERTRGADRREVRLRTTAAGQMLVERVQDSYADRIAAVLGELTRAEQQSLELGLKAFLRAALTSPDQCDAACLRCGVDHVDDCLVHLADTTHAGGSVAALEHRSR